MAKAADEALIGRTLAGKFVVESFIGGGAMGAVYRARQLSLDKAIAIKVLHGDLVSDPTFIARFEREAKAASRLDHPNSMRVLDFGRDADGVCYIAMELLDGQSLFSILRAARGPLPDTRTVDLARQVLAALAVAHEMGVVHRDLKPENIIVLASKTDDGNVTETVKVCDFGMAKIMAGDGAVDKSLEKLTSHGVIVGTPEYMSPEQGKGEDLDERSDLYAVGVILYQMLTGTLPFQADTPIATVLKHLVEEPKPPSQIVPGVNLALEAVCLRALRKVREERFASAREMRAALGDALTDGAHPAPASVRLDAIPRAPRDSSALLAAAAHSPTLPAIPLRRRLAAEALASSGEPSRVMPVLVAIAVAAIAIGGIVVFRAKQAPTAVAARVETPHSSTGHAVPATRVPPVEHALPPPIERAAPSSAASSWYEPPPSASPSASSSTKALSIALASKGGSKPAGAVAPPLVLAPVAGLPTMDAAPPVAMPIAIPPPSSPSASVAPPSPLEPFEQASVSFGAVKTNHAQAGDVLVALPARRFNQCYRDGLRARGAPVRGSGTLHLGFEGNGHVSEATFAGPPDLAAIGQCVANSAIGSDVHNVESGATGADVDLSFKPD